MNIDLTKEELIVLDDALVYFANTHGTHDIIDSLMRRLNARAHGYWMDNSKEIWWCEVHKRQATWMFQPVDCDPALNPPQHRCDPNLGGILMGCLCKRIEHVLITKEGIVPA